MLRRADAQDGLTLVELMIVVLILGVVGGITTTGLVQGMRTSQDVDARVQAFTALQRTSERVARDLRRAVWTDVSAEPPPADPPTGCTFVSLDPGDLTMIVFEDTDRYRHHYTVSGDELRLDVDVWSAGAWDDHSDRLVMDGLDSATFGYLDAAGHDLLADGIQGNDRARVRKFGLTLVASLPDQDPVELSTTVAARNGGVPCPVA
jgi:prepilin-type N-terminal cleavage/methylation domain-containing protein